MHASAYLTKPDMQHALCLELLRLALNARRHEQWGEQIHRLRGLLPKALDVLEQELEGENRLQAAVHVLKACKLYGIPVVAGPTEVEDIVIAAQSRLQQRESKTMLTGMRSTAASRSHGSSSHA
jgi:hypothetical protein